MRRTMLVVLSTIAALAATATSALAIAVTPVSVAGAPLGITAGPDGNMWFVEVAGSRFGRLTPGDAVTDFSTGSGISAAAEPWGIAAGADGALWFTEQAGSRIGRIAPGPPPVATEFTLAPSGPRGIALGPDGAMWFTEDGPSHIGRITTAGTVTEFSTGITPGSRPLSIATGPDGNLWFTELARGVGRITPSGTVTEFTAGIPADAEPSGIAAGPDGALWFTMSTDRVGRITTDGAVTIIPVSPGAQPRGIAVGPDGNLWFVEESGDALGRVTTAGVVTEFPVTVPGGEPLEIAAGPGRQLWVTSRDGVSRVRLDPVVRTGAATAAAGGATVTGTVDPLADATTWSVDYGTTPAYGSSAPGGVVPAGPGPVAVSAALPGLPAGTTIHYRLVATSAAGTSAGEDRTLLTPASPPGGGPGTIAGTDRTPPRVRIGTAPLRLDRRGRVRVRIACPSTEPRGCRAVLRLTSASRLRMRSGVVSVRRLLPLGQAAARLGGGGSRVVTVVVPRAGRRQVARLHTLRVRIAVTAADVAGNRATTTRVVVLRAPVHR